MFKKLCNAWFMRVDYSGPYHDIGEKWIERRFIWFPKILDGEIRWLCNANIERYAAYHEGDYDVRFVD